MNSQGVVRNRQTGYVLKWQTRNVSNKQISLRDDNGKSVCLSYPSLMLQLFGERVGKKTPVPVNIVKGNCGLLFLLQIPFRTTNKIEVKQMKIEGYAKEIADFFALGYYSSAYFKINIERVPEAYNNGKKNVAEEFTSEPPVCGGDCRPTWQGEPH